MNAETNKMAPFEFLIGSWNLDYWFPKSCLSEVEGTGTGLGTFQRTLNGKYVTLDYTCSLTTGDGAAHALFAWDERTGIYRYWWFESSGQYNTACCRFIDDDTLFLQWGDSLLTQTFKKDGPDQVTLKMSHPNANGEYETVLQVVFTRAKE